MMDPDAIVSALVFHWIDSSYFQWMELEQDGTEHLFCN
jgi:hypothetical protein